ncbi:MAG: pSer/pThr/pTyr-binding forkhead associated (FHA) protein [Planctomycetota bacterium]|jgi:pSer/pThr/pTyr-binding forkhead associated (FHA) protein
MATRFWLCIKSGERRDETIPIAGEAVVVGRAAECALSLTAPGLSGKHARFELEAGGVRVTDLESRNGTKVDGVSVTSHLLAHGDRIALGKIEFELVDHEFLGEVDLEAPAEESISISHIDRSQVQKSGGLSPILLVALLLAVSAGGYYAYQEWGGGEEVKVKARAAVQPVAGDLLSDGSFEKETTLRSWVEAENSPFEISATHRNRGELGLGAHLAEDERVRIASPWCSVRVGRVINAVGSMRLRGSAACNLSLELGRSSNDEQTLELLASKVMASDGFVEFKLSEQVLPGFDRARLVLITTVAPSEDGEHMVSIDDVAMTVSTDGAGAVTRFEEFELFPHDADASSASLICIDDVLVSSLQFKSPSGRTSIEVASTQTGLKLSPASGGANLNLSFVISDTLVGRGMATMHAESGTAGQANSGRIQTRSGEFKASGVTGFIAGEGSLLSRFGFSSPVELASKRVKGGLLVQALALRGPIELQLNFQAERNRAADLAAEARRADRAGQPGLCLATWGTLLATVPFDAELVSEANAARGKHLGAGLDLVEAVRADFERAQFFKLPDIYRENVRRVNEIQNSYTGSEVAEAAERLASEIEAELATFREQEQRVGQQQMKGVVEALESAGAERLAEHVKQAVQASSNTKAGL